MKPNQIHEVLDLAYTATKNGDVFNPLFSGDAGLGKSAIIQQWCNKNKFPFIDLRGAYLESPDCVGYPNVILKDGRQITKHATPEFWPTEGHGVLLIEEPNRATTAVLNTFMQLLTDRKVHMYEFPPGWMIVGAINPENEHYDVNTMDAALKNRFVTFDVEYDKVSFLEYMKNSNWDKSIITFIESNSWTYTKPENLASTPGTKYISPRTFHQLETALKAKVNTEIEYMVYASILGKNVGKAFYAWKTNEQPVLYNDLVNKTKSALKRLEAFADPNNYKNSQISVTIADILENKDISDELLAKVVLVLPSDQGPVLIKDLEYVRKDMQLLTRLCKNFPEVKKYFQSILNKE
jgi:AAA domain (dynein-related subfamily)